MSNKIRTAVIGVGHLGRHHARVYSELPNSQLVAVVDHDLKRAQEYATKYGCEATTDYKSLKGKVDAVSVVVPTRHHYEVGAWCFENGIHALVEKPMAFTVEECEKLTTLAAQRKCRLQVGHIERYNPALRTVRNELKDVAFIEAHRLSPYPFRSTDVGAIMDVMVHDLDIILDMAQSKVAEIRANATPVLSRKHEDIASARVMFESGAVANITASRVSDKVARKMRVFCKSKYVNIDFGAKQAWIYAGSPKLMDPSFEVEKVDVSGVGNLMQFVFSDLIKVNQVTIADETEPLKAELRAFLDCVETGRTPDVTGEDGTRAIALAQGILAEAKRHEQRFGNLRTLAAR